MRKILFVLSFGLALNCYADANTDASQSSSSGGFFSGMQDIYNKITNFSGTQPETRPSETTQSEPNHLQSGLNAMTTDDYKTAIPAFKASIAKDPNNKAAYIGLIRALTQSGNYAEADQTLNTYRTKFGEDNQYQMEKARYFALTGNYNAAQQTLDPLLKNDPTNDLLLDIQQYIKERHDGSKPAAALDTTEVAATEPTSTSDQNQSNNTSAVTQSDDSQAVMSDEKTAQIEKARTLLIDAKYSQGEKVLQDYKSQYGEDDAYLTEQARYYALTNQPDKSFAILKPLLEKDPNNDTLLTIQEYAKTHPAEKTYSAGKRVGGATTVHTPTVADEKQQLAEINRALDKDPSNPNLLLRRAQIAGMVDDQLTVYNSYSALYVSNPDNKEIMLGLARAASRLAKTDQANYLYSTYISRWPNEPKIWIEWAYNESWSGNDRAAIHILDWYHQRFGGPDEYWIARARIISSADRPREALCIINSLLPKYPDNYDLNYANATALYYNYQPIEMFSSLARLNRLAPGTEETEGLNAFIWTPYRNNVSLDLYDSFDSDTVKIARATLAGQYYWSPKTYLLGNVTGERLSASIGSGLNPIEGGHAIKLTTANIGINHRFNPIVDLQGIIGGGHASNGESAMLYQGDAFLQFTDTAQADIMIKRSFYDQSARAVSLGITQNLYQGLFLFQPCIQCYINVNGAYATFSDNNTMRFAEVNPAANIIATERWNIRMGVDGQWYKFTRHTNHGYYDPFNYHYYAFNTDIYLKQSDNIGYEFYVALGTQKDETFATYTAANDFSGKAYFGIYHDWFLVLSAGASTRGRSIANNPNVGTYRVYNFDAMITRRL